MANPKGFFAIAILFAVSANWLPPTRERIVADVQSILQKCEAEKVISVVVEETTKLQIVRLKKASERNEADLRALRCVGRQSTGAVDFRPVAELLLTVPDKD